MPFDIWLDEFGINPRTSGSQSDPQITQLANGNILVVWQTPAINQLLGDPPYDATIAHIYDPLGNLISNEFFLNGTYTGANGPIPLSTLSGDVSAIPSGGFVSVIVTDASFIGNVKSAIRLITYDNNGNATFATFLTDNTPTTGSMPPFFSDPQVVTSSNTSSMITYVQDYDTGNEQVVGHIYNPSTHQISAQINFIEEPGEIFTYDTAVLTNGNYVITSHTDAGANGLYMRIVDPDGFNVLSTIAVNTTVSDLDNDYAPTVTALAGGGFVIAWTNFDENDADVLLQIYDTAGTPVGGELSANTGLSNDEIADELIALDDGSFLLIYTDFVSNQTFVQQYSATGVKVGARQDLTTGMASNIEGVQLADGRIAITFKQGEIGMVIFDPRDGHNTTGVYDGDYIIGTIGNDIITESSSNLHFGWDGNDAIYAQAGTSIGTDEYDGGNGTDTINFSGSTESFATFNLSSGIVTTSDNVDHVMVNFENIVGTAQTDIIILTTGNNQAYAGDGNDQITTFGGVDQIYGEAGIDTIFINGISLIGGSYFDGGADNDTFDFSALNSNYTANLTTLIFSGVSGSFIVNFENIVGGTGNDIITGDLYANVLSGGAGDDTIETVGGLDVLQGGAGNDTLIVSAVTFAGGVLFAGGSGTDTFSFSGLQSSYDANLTTGVFSRLNGSAPNTLDSIENIIGGNGNDTITGNLNDNNLNGGAGNDTIETVGGLDTLRGDAGNDTLIASAFTLAGGTSYEGGAGTDTFSFSGLQSSYEANLTTGVFSRLNGSAPNALDSIENVIGGNGNDTLAGNLSDNILIGGAGDDIIETVGGLDVLQGGAGDDTLIASAVTLTGGTSYEGGAGTDTFSFAGLQSSYEANLTTGVFSRLNGSAPNALDSIENIIGGNGNDTITGNLNDNILDGGAGDDTLDGGAGADTVVYSGIQANYLVTDKLDGTYTVTDNVGSDGTDTLTNVEFLQFTSGTVTVADAAGGGDINLTNNDDVFTATAADEVINALDGNDLVNAGAGNDIVNGGDGNDNLRGDAGVDELNGGFGADILRGGAGADVLNGGAGADVADYTTSGGAIGVTVNLATNVNTGGDAQGDTLFFIDRVNGSTRADNITGNANVNYLRGFAQDDTLIGGAGNDYLQGDGGADMLDGGAGTNDWAYYFSSPTGLTVNLGNPALNTGEAVGDVYIAIENLLGSQHDDFLYGDSSNNFLRGVQGDDELYGGDGNDFLRGDQGADLHDGGAGVDWAYYATSSAAVTINLGTGAALGGDATGDTFISIERVYGSVFDDDITGDAGANYLRGSSGNDTLTGGGGNDFLQGDSGADVLDGGAGADWAYYASATTNVVVDLGTPSNNTAEATGDSYISIENVVGGRFNDTIIGDSNDNTLRGFLGDDTLNGGGGNDILRGEAGNDTFVFEVGGDNDTVIDWVDADDMLDLSDFGFADITAAMATAADVSGDVVFTIGADTITIEDTTTTDIMDNLIV